MGNRACDRFGVNSGLKRRKRATSFVAFARIGSEDSEFEERMAFIVRGAAIVSGLPVIRPPRDTPTPGDDFLFGDSSLRNTPAVQSSGARVKITGARNTTDRVPRRRREGGGEGISSSRV